MAEAMVTISDVGKRFGARAALTDVSTRVEAGDVIGILGKNGAGKTTLLEVLLGFSPASAGSVTIFGEDCLSLSSSAKSRIGFVPQQDELLGMLTGRQQLAITAAFHRSWDHSLIQQLLTEWAVPTEQRIQTMSVGERQKLSVLTALGHHPELLVLDEPVASLDPIARRQFLAQLFDASEGQKRAVLFSSHIVSDLERAATKIWIIKEGRLYWQGDTDALKESVVRVHVRSSKPLPQNLAIANAITVHVQGGYATAAVTQWGPEVRDGIASRLQADVEVEPLGLEEIFIELHK